MLRGILVLIAYIVAASFPLVVAGLYVPGGDDFADEFGKALALAGLGILALQPVIAARLKPLTKPFGLDIVLRFHRFMGFFALILLVLHPLFLAIGHGSTRLLTDMYLPWYIWAGKITLVLVVLLVATSALRKKMGLSFETWKEWHSLFAPVLLITAASHVLILSDGVAKVALALMVVVGLLGFVYWRFIKPHYLSKHAFTVFASTRENDNVRTLTLKPAAGSRPYAFLPGQFHFLTIQSTGLPVEEHHFTIASSPAATGLVSSTIKACGDFTSALGAVEPGDRVLVDGPYGRFSYLLHPAERRFLFVAGGIGITPLMSMLRHMRDIQFNVPVHLIYANRSRSNILFEKELAEIVALGRPKLRVEHVLSRPDSSWIGRTGRINTSLLAELIPQGKEPLGVYVCGPKSMQSTVFAGLAELGVPPLHIHSEEFILLD